MAASSILQSDRANAFMWHKKAAELGDTESQYILGLHYEVGAGTSPSSINAFYWMRKAAENGKSEAQQRLGYYYENGYGATKSTTDAAKWYMLSLQNNQNSETSYKIGFFYRHGIGFPQNYALAKHYLSNASRDGHPDALLMLGMMYRDNLVNSDSYFIQSPPKIKSLLELEIKAFDLADRSLSKNAAKDNKNEVAEINIIAAHVCFNLSAAKGNAESSKQKEAIEKK